MTDQDWHLPSLQAQNLMLKVNLTKREYTRAHQLWYVGDCTDEEFDKAAKDMQAAQIALNKYIKELENGQAI